VLNAAVAQVRKNLHVVFTMNPASPEFHNRTATSPALFNRCVLDWFGEWSDEALFQVRLVDHADRLALVITPTLPRSAPSLRSTSIWTIRATSRRSSSRRRRSRSLIRRLTAKPSSGIP
jgi:hypothetical protein